MRSTTKQTKTLSTRSTTQASTVRGSYGAGDVDN